MQFQPPNPSLPWPLDYDQGVLPLARSEGLALVAYLCPAGVWTNGYGETDGVGPTTEWTKEYADQRFLDSLTERVHKVINLCTVQPTALQLCALVSLCYNIGVEGLRNSTVLKCHNRSDFPAASRAFGLWNKIRNKKTGKLEESNGLTIRRAKEAAQYLEGSGQYEMPQDVVAETKLSKSPISQGGAITAVTGGLGVVASTKENITQVSSTVQQSKGFISDTLGIPAEWVLPLLLIVVGIGIMWYRHKQREQGWA